MNDKLIINNGKTFTFAGPSNVGKTFIIKYLSKTMADNHKRIAVIDATDNRELYFHICTGQEEQYSDSLNALAEGDIKPNSFGSIDFYTSHPRHKAHYPLIFRQLDSLADEYDYIFIDTDPEYKSAMLLAPLTKLVVVQDYRRMSIQLNQKEFLIPLIRDHGEGCVKEAFIVFNQEVSCKVKLEYLEQNLMFTNQGQEHIRLLMDAKLEDIQIPLLVETISADANNQLDGVINVVKLPNEIKKSFIRFASMLEKVVV